MTDITGALRLFGVIDADITHLQPDVIGTTLVAFRDLAAMVEPATYERRELDEAALADYIRVVDAAAECGPVIPAPPGTVFQNVGTLRHWLELHYAKLHETLGVIERREGTNPPYEFVRMQFGN